ncbi:PREDICTED: activating signal cointegrator 1 complex subunit 3-like [Poecilia mexicana]|uniref:activating signal cointegrator 1 complex subunit 3-like n=1 Tax=Poecilia mexicana TaxID=48701 RepID=UPI00072ECA85|nr:PREDICTED: activating signal cointegrator 1 complex subunit 3-like [Poecilia mexicana]
MSFCFPDVSRKVSGEMTKPAYGCQVIIQSEKEKQMMKIYRREEKKEKKRAKGNDDGDFSEAVLAFDPKEMRAQREHALLNARYEPLLTRERVYERIRYPNVYDSYAEATKAPAFVGGARLLLPEGIHRENNKIYEEVEIPYNEPMPVGFEERPVYISELDELLLPEGIHRENNKIYEEVEIPYNEPMPVGFEERPVYISELDERERYLYKDTYSFRIARKMKQLNS